MLIVSDKTFYFTLLLSAFISCSQPEASYHEKYRPQVHFSPLENRMDAPAGLVYLNGEYHLFYLYNPSGTDGNPKHWGHAVSTDLIHWNHLPIALSPDSLGAIASGSVVYDEKNTSGLGTTENPPLVAIFTYHNYEAEYSGDINVQTQGLAYSSDKGRTWTKYSDNPVVPNPGIRDFHDPKIIWYEPEEHWIMILAVEGRIRIYTSPDLKNWCYASDFGLNLDSQENRWERPDLFELPIGNGSKQTRWILTVNVEFGLTKEWKTGFFAGDFDGRIFSSSQTSPYGIDYGNDNYGGLTFNNLPGGRHVLIGWMNNREYADNIPASSWRGSLTVPRELRLKQTLYYYILASQPVEEVSTLYDKHVLMQNIDIVQDIHSSGFVDMSPCIKFPLCPSEINIRFRTDKHPQLGFAERFGIKIRNKKGESILAGYDAYHQQFYIDHASHSTIDIFPGTRSVAQVPGQDINESETFDMRIILDATSIELFAMDGNIVITNSFYPSSDFNVMEIYAENGKVHVESISVTQLKSIWEGCNSNCRRFNGFPSSLRGTKQSRVPALDCFTLRVRNDAP
ncbi:MAG: glycoside hydrolase family 32 protein [Tannerellaceae bacterium]|jgi:fructan beta-fructosidase|nr:glycoside hydrolase family 32 protein [Tannerellaceae bacterium]